MKEAPKWSKYAVKLVCTNGRGPRCWEMAKKSRPGSGCGQVSDPTTRSFYSHWNRIEQGTGFHELTFSCVPTIRLQISWPFGSRCIEVCRYTYFPLRSVILCGFCKHHDSLTAVNMQMTVSNLKWYPQLPHNTGNFYQIIWRRQQDTFKTPISVRMCFMTVCNGGLTALTFYSLLLACCTNRFNIQDFYALPKLYLCVLYLSENKQRLVPLTAKIDWFL